MELCQCQLWFGGENLRFYFLCSTAPLFWGWKRELFIETGQIRISAITRWRLAKQTTPGQCGTVQCEAVVNKSNKLVNYVVIKCYQLKLCWLTQGSEEPGPGWQSPSWSWSWTRGWCSWSSLASPACVDKCSHVVWVTVSRVLVRPRIEDRLSEAGTGPGHEAATGGRAADSRGHADLGTNSSKYILLQTCVHNHQPDQTQTSTIT